MAYSTNPNLPKARASAMRLLLEDGLSVSTVALRCGVHRTTIYRWKRKWQDLNQNMETKNHYRPNRKKTTKLHGYSWSIPTLSSRPHSCPHAVPDSLVNLVLEVRDRLKRCAEVVWHHLKYKLKIFLSLSSVKRILRRHHYFDGARKPRLKPDNPKRPPATYPGQLGQVDTIVHLDPTTGKRTYYITVIDLYTRMAYTKSSRRLNPGVAARVVLEAQGVMGLEFEMVQTDNGQEFSRYFEQTLRKAGVAVRHSRLGRPNDNAHIERFNRTIQEECIGSWTNGSVPLPKLQAKLDSYLYHYNSERVHLGIQLRTPVEMLQSS